MSTNTLLYDDGLIRLDASTLTIRHYYFPLATSKRIRYNRLRSIKNVPIGPATGQWRMWGTGDFRHWLPLDLHRPQRDAALVCDLGGWVRPVITPKEPQRVIDILREHGVAV